MSADRNEFFGCIVQAAFAVVFFWRMAYACDCMPIGWQVGISHSRGFGLSNCYHSWLGTLVWLVVLSLKGDGTDRRLRGLSLTGGMPVVPKGVTIDPRSRRSVPPTAGPAWGPGGVAVTDSEGTGRAAAGPRHAFGRRTCFLLAGGFEALGFHAFDIRPGPFNEGQPGAAALHRRPRKFDRLQPPKPRNRAARASARPRRAGRAGNPADGGLRGSAAILRPVIPFVGPMGRRLSRWACEAPPSDPSAAGRPPGLDSCVPRPAPQP